MRNLDAFTYSMVRHTVSINGQIRLSLGSLFVYNTPAVDFINTTRHTHTQYLFNERKLNQIESNYCFISMFNSNQITLILLNSSQFKLFFFFCVLFLIFYF